MRPLLLGALAAVLWGVTDDAAGQEAVLSYLPDGRLKITDTVLVPAGCFHAGTPRLGAPEGERDIANAIEVTFPIEQREPAACFEDEKTGAVTFEFVVRRLADTEAVIIYETSDALGTTVRAAAVPPPS